MVAWWKPLNCCWWFLRFQLAASPLSYRPSATLPEGCTLSQVAVVICDEIWEELMWASCWLINLHRHGIQGSCPTHRTERHLRHGIHHGGFCRIWAFDGLLHLLSNASMEVRCCKVCNDLVVIGQKCLNVGILMWCKLVACWVPTLLWCQGNASCCTHIPLQECPRTMLHCIRDALTLIFGFPTFESMT